jgi:PleD family two-component response regulator
MKMKIQKSKILIVDDKPENMCILDEILKEEYTTISVTNGKSALQIAQTPPHPDLILLDIIMPDMDGYEVCKRLKENETTREIPVIFITAMSEVMDDVRAFENGCVDYVVKPFYPPAVRARVGNHIKLKNVTVELQKVIDELKGALAKVKILNGLLPICAHCKKIRDDKGYWKQVEEYIEKYSNVQFSHGICPGCAKELYPEFCD